MIRLGLRLAIAGGRDAIARLVTIAAAVALGVLLVTSILAALNGFFAQNTRYAWFNSGSQHAAATAPAAAEPLWWRIDHDQFDRQEIGRVDVAPTGPHSPVPPGIPRLPGPGEYYASPALAALLRSTPADELADRYPGHLAGTIGQAALPSPDTLVIIVGYRADQLSHQQGARQITLINGTSPDDCGCEIGVDAAGIDLVVSVVAAGLLFPLLIFVAAATRLSAARREERFAAMHLVGATPRQISVLATVEAAAAAVIGTALGFALFYLLRDRIATIPLTGDPFFPSELRLGGWEIAAVALGVPVAAALAARVALRRVRISPLGVSRRATPRPPRAYRLIPLVAGIAELAYLVGRRPETNNGQTFAYLTGFLLIMAGLVAAGPWLTMVGSRFLARRARRSAPLIAARRLADNPHAGFRAVSGLVLALFVSSVAVGVITTIDDYRGPVAVGTQFRGTLTQDFFDDEHRRPGTATVVADPVPAGLRGLPGVRGVTVFRVNPASTARSPIPDGLVSCVDLARIPQYGQCPPGAEVAEIFPDVRQRGPDGPDGPHPPYVWPAATVGADQLTRLPVLTIMVQTNGSTATVERARSVLELAYPDQSMPVLDGDFGNTFTNMLAGWQQLANVVIIASLVIAGLSLAVVMAGGLSERKRPFSLLRLTGVQLSVLRRIVVLETAVPLLVAAVLATGAGFLAAHLFLRAQMDYTLRPPGVVFYVISAAGLLASLGIIASTLPMLRRITGPETARNG
ncbi:ABC transporter permease [Rugosimonospora acidiphila]|uniref:ABC transporter permease n=1 Tax=Rugosimonospora acidiphila TaxID=556531 RepID=A0ABP9S084_9ACTN